MSLNFEAALSYRSCEASGSVTLSAVPCRTKNGTVTELKFRIKYEDIRSISCPVRTLIGPVYTKGSEYFATKAAGSLETGMPLLFAPLNWNLGATREKIGATACINTSINKMHQAHSNNGLWPFKT